MIETVLPMTEEGQRTAKRFISVRPVHPNDEAFLFRLFSSVRGPIYDALPLEPARKQQLMRMQFEAQLAHYRSRYPRADFHIVLAEGVPIGNLYVHRGRTEFVLIDIALKIELRNQGIGSRLVRAVIDEAGEAGVPLRAQVARENPARRLWRRLGFRQVGEDDVYAQISIDPPAAGP